MQHLVRGTSACTVWHLQHFCTAAWAQCQGSTRHEDLVSHALFLHPFCELRLDLCAPSAIGFDATGMARMILQGRTMSHALRARCSLALTERHLD